MKMNYKFTNLGILIALVLSAASALIYEVAATKVLFFYFIESSYSIATVLSVFLFGLGVGSLLTYKLLHKIQNKKALFGVFQVLIAVYAFFILANSVKIIPKFSTFGVIAASFAILLIPTIFLGAIFPLAGSIFIKERKEIIGLVYSVDLFGAIIGALIAGFLLIPIWGIRVAVLFGAGLNLLSAFIILPKMKKAVPLVSLIIFLILGVSISKPVTDNDSDLTENEYKFYANSPYGEIKVDGRYELSIDGRGQCSYLDKNDTTERTMVDFALAPFDPLDYDRLNVVNIGLGCGLTLSRILDLIDNSVDIVEINPVVVSANKEFTDVLEDKRVNLIVEDGLKYLRQTRKKYHSILIDIENPAVAHSSGLYTVEAFKIINDDLTEDGTFALWIYGGTRRFLDILYYSLKEASFPFVYHVDGDIFLASKQKLELEEYVPSMAYEINSVDRNTLTQAYLKKN